MAAPYRNRNSTLYFPRNIFNFSGLRTNSFEENQFLLYITVLEHNMTRLLKMMVKKVALFQKLRCLNYAWKYTIQRVDKNIVMQKWKFLIENNITFL